MVIVVLLAKADGGYRPIGLIPALPRIWMRVRRSAAKQWEDMQARDYLYAGAAKGATVAAWKQSARAPAQNTGRVSVSASPTAQHMLTCKTKRGAFMVQMTEFLTANRGEIMPGKGREGTTHREDFCHSPRAESFEAVVYTGEVGEAQV